MKLGDILKDVEIIQAPGSDPTIRAITRDSREVEPGDVFVAVKGSTVDGKAYFEDAVARGASAVVLEPPAPETDPPVAVVVVPDGKLALALMSRNLHSDPSAAMLVVGITGTNGKTTTAFLSASILEASGLSTGLLGSIVYRVGTKTSPSELTTPEAYRIQGMLAEMRSLGQAACVLEVSSHGLAQKRAEGISFDIGVFTNLDQDHLDFHGDAEHYFLAKTRLFEMLPAAATGVLNADDPSFARMRGFSRAPVLTFSTGTRGDVRLVKAICSPLGTQLSIQTPSGPLEIESTLVGRHNVSNILAAAAVGCAASLKPEAIPAGIKSVETIPGRLEPVRLGQPFHVWVDFAHTAHALGGCLRSLQELKPARIIAVFGCGGDRDTRRREAMGEQAAKLADLPVITSDNPRSEDPEAILRQVEKGVQTQRQSGYIVEPDRRKAIRAALTQAQPGDFVLIAGKGHERFQLVGERRLPLDDREEAEQVLRELGYEGQTR